jgi:ethanolamine utilization protein EutN
MIVGKVVGKVVSTIKYETLIGKKLLVVRIYENGKPGELAIAADSLKVAGQGDFVYMITSKEASGAFRENLLPVDMAIMGFIDEYRGERKVLKN